MRSAAMGMTDDAGRQTDGFWDLHDFEVLGGSCGFMAARASGLPLPAPPRVRLHKDYKMVSPVFPVGCAVHLIEWLFVPQPGSLAFWRPRLAEPW